MTRAEIDRRMREVLAQLSTCSHVPAAPWQPTGRSRASDEHPGGGQPPGDLGEAYWAREYGPPFWEPTPGAPGCRTDEERLLVLERAHEDLVSIRGRGIQERRPAGESFDARNKRIVKDYEGWPAKEVAIEVRCAERDVRKARMLDGREPEEGRKPEKTDRVCQRESCSNPIPAGRRSGARYCSVRCAKAAAQAAYRQRAA